MTDDSGLAAWRVVSGSARGNAHEVRHAPNQDSFGSRPIAGDGLVVAVADGHGADRHFRSLAGSMLAARAACTVATELTDEAAGPWSAELAGTLREVLPRTIVARWRELVAQHLAGHPFSAAEEAGLEARGDGTAVPYGSTLLVALAAEDWLVCAQIGDGDMLAVRPDGTGWTPVDDDPTLDGLHTTSLCQLGAVGSFRTAAHDLRTEPALALLLGTDGYGNAQAAREWRPAVARQVAELAARDDAEQWEDEVQSWAERSASSAGSGDDTTIALLLAPDSGRLATDVQPALDPGASLPPAPAPAPASAPVQSRPAPSGISRLARRLARRRDR